MLNFQIFALSINAVDGLIELNPVSAKLYRGTYSGNIVLNAKDKIPSLTMQSKLGSCTNGTSVKRCDGHG